MALLRGVNVGGRNKLPMTDLARIFASLGCDDVVTCIQSGNVVFRAPRVVLARLPRAVPEEIAGQFGFEAPIVLRSGLEMCRIAAEHPFDGRGVDPKSLYVAFLRDVPGAKAAAALDAQRSPGDVFRVRGAEVYLRFGSATGAARTKLTVDWFDRQLATVTTVRNWRTTRTLCEMASD